MAAVATAAATSVSAASTTANIVADPELSSSVSYRSTAFTDSDHIWVLICFMCKEPVPVSAAEVVKKWSSGQRLHIQCLKQQCGAIVCYSSSPPIGASFSRLSEGAPSDAVYSSASAANTVRSFTCG